VADQLEQLLAAIVAGQGSGRGATGCARRHVVDTASATADLTTDLNGDLNSDSAPTRPN
jgi:hypothetical protein